MPEALVMDAFGSHALKAPKPPAPMNTSKFLPPPAEVLKLVAKCREDFQKILETVDVKPSGARGL